MSPARLGLPLPKAERIERGDRLAREEEIFTWVSYLWQGVQGVWLEYHGQRSAWDGVRRY